MVPIEYKSEFEELLVPLETMILVVYNEHIRYSIFKLYKDHGTDISISTTAISAQQELINNGTKTILLQLSKIYIKSLLRFFSHDGLTLYIISNLKTYINNDLNSKLENSQNKSSAKLSLMD